MCGAQTAVTLQFFTLYKSDYNNFHGLYSNGPFRAFDQSVCAIESLILQKVSVNQWPP